VHVNAREDRATTQVRDESERLTEALPAAP
jgi:hypothetical protein